ncbi:MAG: chromate transporter [Clostridiales bacterium]|nr:chromate transporter [Clostridiales bacterium]
MKEIIRIFTSFFKIGIMTFGGGYAMLPFIQKEIVEKHGWATNEEVIDYYAIGQCTPGIIAVNTATFIGYFHKGLPGAVSAALGVISPSILIITIIAAFIQQFSDAPIVQYAFSGITAAVAVIIINAVIKLWKSGVKNVFGVVIFALALVAEVILNIPTMLIIITAVVLGIVMELVRRGRKKGDER